jgi:ABC-type phosphate/phosphonate transport system substrate-binding protein|tara:strand:- start:523 stop:756 length:234 start_codon:yes stop_codon:yes gene_type:complete
MTQLEELKQSVSKMSNEERMEKLREIREDRKISKHAITVRKKRDQDRSGKLIKSFDTMSEQDQAAFLAMIQEKSGEG